MSRQLFDPAVTSHADVDRLLRTEPQVQLTNPPVLNNHSNDFKSHCTFPDAGVCPSNDGHRKQLAIIKATIQHSCEVVTRIECAELS